jgi:hypothetical protein
MTVPSGFVYAGQLYAASPAGQGNDIKQDVSLTLPQNAKIDRSYHQPGDGFQNSGGGAAGNFTAGDIPSGLYIECHGSDSNGKRWAINLPYSGSKVLTPASWDDEGQITQWRFTLGMYVDSGEQMFAGGANANVDVWFKPGVG